MGARQGRDANAIHGVPDGEDEVGDVEQALPVAANDQSGFDGSHRYTGLVPSIDATPRGPLGNPAQPCHRNRMGFRKHDAAHILQVAFVFYQNTVRTPEDTITISFTARASVKKAEGLLV